MRRSTNQFDEDLEDNAYNSSVKYTRNSRDSGNAKLYVSNIPLGLNENGLLNFFLNAGFEALNAFIGKPDPNNKKSNTTWGFVEFRSVSIAQEAINTLNRVPPHNMSIAFARPKGDKSDSKSDDFDFCSVVSSSSTMHSRGRGMVPPMEGKPPSRFPARAPFEEPFFGDSSNLNYPNDKFMPPNDLYDVEASNAVNSATDTYSLDGRRKVVLGRGTYVPPENKPIQTRVTVDDIPEDELDRYMSLYISRRYKQVADESAVEIACQDQCLNIIFKLGQCVSCFRPSLYVCATCKAWYCSKYCRRIDADDHQKICTPKKLVKINDDGSLMLVDLEQFSDAVDKMDNLTLHEPKSPNDKSPRQPKGNSYDRNDSKAKRKPQSSLPSQELPSQSNRSPNQDYHFGNRSDRNSQENFSNGQDNSFEDERRGHQRNQRESGGQRGGGQGNRGGRGGRSSGSDRDRDRDGGDRGEGINRDHGGGSNRRGGGARDNLRSNNRGVSDRSSDNHSGPENFNNDNRNKYRDDPFEAKIQTSIKTNIENGVYRPGRENNSQKSSRSANNQPQSHPPIPYNQFTEVTVTALSNEKLRFWAYSSTVQGQQLEIMQELGTHSKTAKPFNSKLIPGLKVCAPFCGDWYRAEVKSVSDDEVKILFIDFGNEASVATKDILPLPLSIANKPVLAHQYVLAKSPNNPMIADDVTLKLKPIKLVGDAWVAHAEGVTYEEQNEEVTITVVTEKDGEFWVRNVEDDELLEELNTSLGEHSTIKVNPSLDEIYAYRFNKSWLRAKVVNRSPLTIFFIDKGFSINTCVKKNDLHPIPYRYSTLRPLAYKIKVTEESYNAFSSNLKLWQQIFIKAIEKTSEAVTCKVVGVSDYSSPPRHSSHSGKGPEMDSSHLLDNPSENKLSELRIERQLNDELLTGSLIPLGQPPIFSKISSMIAKNIKKEDHFKFIEGMLLAAKWDDSWHRGRLLLMRGKDPLVALLDRGRVVIPEAVSLLPNISNVPESAVKVVLKNPTSESITAGTILKLKELNEIGDLVQADIETLGEALLVPWEPSIEDAGLSVVHIPPGTKVIISSFSSPKTIYLQSMHPGHVVSRAELLQDVATETLLSEPLKRKPHAGELLAVRYTDNLYYRAQVYKKQGERYKVIFVDFGNVDLVKTCDMKPLPPNLKALPCHAVKVGLKGLSDEPFNNQCVHYLNDLTGIETQFCLDYNLDLTNVTLDFMNGENLNSTLLEFMTPSWKKKNFDPAVSDVFTEVNLEYEKWKKGEKFEIIVPKVVKHNSIAVLRIDSKLLSHIESTLTPNITKYCESFDSIYTYVPRPNEVCLAFFEEDGNWYRALSRKIYQQNSSEVFYLDYGNSGVVLHKNIRKMISDFMSTPVALKICKVYGLPDKVAGDVKKRLLEYFNDFKGDAVVVRETPEETTLWIPALESLAAALGFEIKPPHI